MTISPNLSPRAARTRTALIAAGFDLLAEKPIDAIPIDEVVARAGVAKGSFFNHFADKHAFALALASDVRIELEDRIGAANRGVADPIERMAGALRETARLAIHDPKRAAVLMRSTAGTTARDHPLNKGITADFDDACRLKLVRPEARGSGVLFWLGLCVALMANLAERPRSVAEIRARVAEMMVLGLTGLGVDEARARTIALRDDWSI